MKVSRSQLIDGRQEALDRCARQLIDAKPGTPEAEHNRRWINAMDRLLGIPVFDYVGGAA